MASQSSQTKDFKLGPSPRDGQCLVGFCCCQRHQQHLTLRKESHSLSEETLNRLTASRPDWPNHSAKVHKEASLATLALCACEGSFENLQCAWQSLLLIPGSFCTNGERKVLILEVTQHGFMGVRCRSFLQPRDKERYLDLTELPEKPLVYDVVMNPNVWRCVEVEPVPERYWQRFRVSHVFRKKRIASMV